MHGSAFSGLILLGVACLQGIHGLFHIQTLPGRGGLQFCVQVSLNWGSDRKPIWLQVQTAFSGSFQHYW